MTLPDIIRITALAALAAVTAAAPARAEAPVAPLSVTFTGIEAKQGRVLLAVYDEAGWSGGKPVRVAMVDATADPASVTIADLPAGRDGIKAFHDVNGNGKMDANPFGMPIEPFAFSNDARGAQGPASWADAAFTVAVDGARLTITIR